MMREMFFVLKARSIGDRTRRGGSRKFGGVFEIKKNGGEREGLVPLPRKRGMEREKKRGCFGHFKSNTRKDPGRNRKL